MTSSRPVSVERIRHVPRELLRSGDVRDALESEAQLQWWHQRAVHDSFGVVDGLWVKPGPDAGSVTVTPGVAYDCFGRDLHLFAPRVVPLPEEPELMTLLARAPRRTRAEAELVWVETARIEPHAGVPLPRLDGRRGPESIAAARPRALARPRVGAGATRPDGTPWQPIRRFLASRTAAGVEVRVDTRPAGFTDTPCYFAWLHWPRLTSTALPVQLVLAFGLQHVERCSLDGFTFRVWLGFAAGGASGEELVSLARNQQLFVSWLGIQCDGQTQLRRSARGTA
jgi:hypothetical protein